jgi:hypothetical protein
MDMSVFQQPARYLSRTELTQGLHAADKEMKTILKKRIHFSMLALARGGLCERGLCFSLRLK